MEKQSFSSKLIEAFKQEKFLLFCLAYMLLPVPLLTPLAKNIGLDDCLWSVFFSTLLLLTIFVTMQFFAIKTVKACCSVLLIFTLVPSAIFLAYLLFAQAFLLSDSITSIFETNPEESKEFIAYYMNPFITAGIVAYASIPVFMIFKMRGNGVFSICRHKVPFSICITMLLLFVIFRPAAHSVYFINFYKTYIQYKKRHYEEKKEIANRLKQPFAVSKLQPDTLGQTLVVIIGESLTRHHMSLYGYGRKTNVLLNRKDSSLVVYDDVVSPQVHTIPVIRKVMTFLERNHADYFSKRPSLFELFNRAGYETYFISNQPYGGRYETSYDLLLTQAKHQHNPSLQKKPDGVVFPYLQEALGDKKKNKLIVIHLMGNHMAYIFRYPKEYDVFHNDSDDFIRSNAKYMTPEAVKTIDRYDNSVRYNDFVISNIIQFVKKSNNSSAVVYFSDHGEEVYDLRDFAGHAYEKVSSYMCEIPFLVWRSPSFGNYRTDLAFDTKRPFSTADFLYSITDLAGLRYENFDATRSLFNQAFKPRERYVGEYTYQEVKDMTKDLEHSK
jgi:heptose-I-phosphate ethanolaminephosphotransferase